MKHTAEDEQQEKEPFFLRVKLQWNSCNLTTSFFHLTKKKLAGEKGDLCVMVLIIIPT